MPKLEELNDNSLLKKFKLQGSISTNNLVLFDAEGKIQKYQSEVDIIKEFFRLREGLYEARRSYLLAKLAREHALLANKVKFIQAVIAGDLQINRVKR